MATGYYTEGKIVNNTNVGGGTFVPGTPPETTVITPSDLNSKVSLYNIPSLPSSVTTNNLGLAASSALASASAASSVQPETTQTKKQNIFEKYLPSITSQASDIQKINEDAAILEKKQKAAQISTEVDQLDKSYRDEIAQIKLNPNGKFGGALQSDINAATDRYQNNRANLALVYKVASQDYQGAQEIANQKIQALKDTNAANLEAYKLQVEAINNDLSESEKIQVQANIQDKQNKADIVSKAYSDVLNNLHSGGQNVPASVYAAVDAAAQNPKATAGDIYAAAGLYMNKSGTAGSRILETLPTSIQSKVINMANDFGNKTQIKKYIEAVDSVNIVNSIDSKSKNPADHQQIVYAFAKALDPDSAVREGEYATIKKYAQGAVSRYGKEISNAIAGTGFLSEAAITNIKTTITNTLNSRKPGYENTFKETARVINNVAGSNVADELLIDYSGGVNAKSSGNIDYTATLDSIFN